MTGKYFSYSPEDGFQTWGTPEEACAAAESGITLDNTDAMCSVHGIHEGGVETCWGIVQQRTEVNEETNTYYLVDVERPAGVRAARGAEV